MAEVWEDRTKRRSICAAAAFEESDVEVNLMRVFWEQVGALGPVYRLVGQGFSDRDIATKLGLTELRVQACIAWILHFLGFTNRNELIRYTVQDPNTTRVQGEEALGDLQLTEAKIAKLGKPRCTPEEHQFDLGGEA